MTKSLVWAVVGKDGRVSDVAMVEENASFKVELCDLVERNRAPHRILELIPRNEERERAVVELIEFAQDLVDIEALPDLESKNLRAVLARLKELDE